ncbi:DUF1806 family protein, partial [Staphylococcus hominis]|uniref:DUF1806 family protein n=1 Tax=Staphylococcus hominis TaxID=1290 RepID=UPI0037095CDB
MLSFQPLNIFQPIKPQQLQPLLTTFQNKPLYFHLQTTNPPYPNHFHQPLFNPPTFLPNIQVTYQHPQLNPPHKHPFPLPFKLRDP